MMNNKIKMILAGVLAMSMIGITTAAAQTTGSITLTGIVSPVLEITVTQTSGTNLDLTTNTTGFAVATVNERSNNPGGYTVSVTSANAAATGGNMAFFAGTTVGNEDTLDYTLSYGGSAVTLVSGTATVTNVATKTVSSGVDKTVAISYTGAFLNADGYNDTLTFEIVAK